MKQSDLDKAAKEECLYRNLYAYLDACVRITLQFHTYKQNIVYSKSKCSQNTTNLLSVSCVSTELTLGILK